MSDRSVTYTFRGNFSNLGAGLATMGKGVGDLGAKLQGLDKQGAQARRGLTTVGSAAGKVGLLAAAGVAAVVVSAANFEQAMSNVKAATHETSGNMDLLRQAAIQAGQATQFSATEAASAVENLAKAGVSTKDILGGGLTGAMNLAAAGGLDVASAAETAATALTQFKLQGKDVPHVADLLAAAAGKAQGEVSDMSMALKQGGLVAAQMGVSIEETTGTLAAFASAGLIGSDAGTSLKTMLLKLANPSAEAAKTMKALGISAYDAQGNFVGLQALAGQLQTAFKGQSQATRDAALATIFGSDAIRSASVLYDQGAQGIADWTNKVNDQGYAAETAAIKMDNLKGDVEQLKGSLETAFIGAGGGSQGPLRSLVQDATKAVNAFNALPGPLKSTATGLLAITAVIGGGLWFTSKTINGITSMKAGLEQLGVSASTSSRAMRGLAIAGASLATLEVAGHGIQALIDSTREALPGVQELTKQLLTLSATGTAASLDKQFNDLGDSISRIADKSFQESFNDTASGISNVVTGLVGIHTQAGSLSDAKDEINALDQALANIATSGSADQAQQAFADLAKSQGLSKDQQAALLKLMPQYRDALAGDANQSTLAAGATDDLASSTDGLGTAADQAAQDLQDLVKATRDATNAAVDGFDAVTQYRQAMKDAAAQAKKSNAGIDSNSKAALKNRDVISALAAAWNAQDETVLNNNKAFQAARANFIKTAEGMGVSKKAAKQLADQLLQIPEKKIIETQTPGMDAALSKARTLGQILAGLHSKDINIALHYQTLGNRGPTGGGSLPGSPNGRIGAGFGRTSVGGLNLRTPSLRELSGGKDAAVAVTLGLVAKGAHAAADANNDAAKGAKGLKERLHDAEKALARVSKAADNAHNALDSLRSQKADLAAGVTGSLSHDPFGGSLEDFNTQTAADTNDARAVLAALRKLVGNGLDPHSALFQRLAASGNVSLIQQFAALSRAQLAAEARTFAAGQAALGAVGQFAAGSAFDDLIKRQAKVTDHLDSRVHELAQAVKHLEAAVKKMPDKVKQGAHDGSKSGSEQGTRDGQNEHKRRTQVNIRTGVR